MNLYSQTAAAISLADALQSCAAGAVALLYGPHECRFGLCDAPGSLHDQDGKPLTLADYFEARVFNEAAEMRWLNNPETPGLGRAALLSEQEAPASSTPFSASEPVSLPLYENKTLMQHYLLWGQPDATAPGPTPGWTCLSAARIGRLWVPCECSKKGRLHLNAREYLGRVRDAEGNEDPHGNVVVIEERLIGLEEAK